MVIRPLEHDSTPQTFLGITGVNSGQQVIDIVTHSDASAEYVPAALWSHLAYPVTTAGQRGGRPFARLRDRSERGQPPPRHLHPPRVRLGRRAAPD